MVSFVAEAQLNREDSQDAVRWQAGRSLKPRRPGKSRYFRYRQENLEECLVLLVVCAVICEPVSLAVLRLQGRYRVNAEIGLVLAISGGELFRIFRHFRADSLFRNNREFVVC
jgi:hypothetical protein